MSLSNLAKTEVSLPRPRLPKRKRSAEHPRANRRTRRTSRERKGIVGLDLGPGEVIAAQASLDGGIVVDRVLSGEIEHNLIREGHVSEPAKLGAWLKDFFAEHDLPRNVRVGMTSPRSVMRVIDLPPLTDPGDIAAAIKIQAPDHIAMPLERAVLDHQIVGLVDTPTGKKTRVIVVAAHRDAVDRLLAAVREAGLHPEGIDLSAFALTRAMYDPSREDPAPVLYAHVAGVTTLAIARGPLCELTRVSPVGIEQLSGRLAEREAISITEARHRLVNFRADGEIDQQALAVLDAGLADLADDLSKTIEFHAAQHEGPTVTETVISGTAALIPNFPDVLAQRMRGAVRRGTPAAKDPETVAIPLERAAIAAGLAVEEVPSA